MSVQRAAHRLVDHRICRRDRYNVVVEKRKVSDEGKERWEVAGYYPSLRAAARNVTQFWIEDTLFSGQDLGDWIDEILSRVEALVREGAESMEIGG